MNFQCILELLQKSGLKNSNSVFSTKKSVFRILPNIRFPNDVKRCNESSESEPLKNSTCPDSKSPRTPRRSRPVKFHLESEHPSADQCSMRAPHKYFRQSDNRFGITHDKICQDLLSIRFPSRSYSHWGGCLTKKSFPLIF